MLDCGTLDNPKCPRCGDNLENVVDHQSSHCFPHYDLYGTCPESRKRWHITFISENKSISASCLRKENRWDVIEAKIPLPLIMYLIMVVFLSVIFYYAYLQGFGVIF